MGWFLQNGGNNNNGQMTYPTCRDPHVDFYDFMFDLYPSNMRRRTVSLVLPNGNNTRLYSEGHTTTRSGRELGPCLRFDTQDAQRRGLLIEKKHSRRSASPAW